MDDGVLQNLLVNTTNNSIPGVDYKPDFVNITSIELERMALIMSETNFLQNVILTVFLQVIVTIILLTSIYLIGKKIKLFSHQ